MALGFTLTTGVFIGSLTSQFVNSSLRKSTIRNQLVSIKKYCKVLNLSKQKVKEIMDYYFILWTKKKGIREAEDLSLLPKPLRMEICFDINFALLQCSLIFRDKPEAFLRTVALNMKHEFYQPGEIIYYQHVIKYKMVRSYHFFVVTILFGFAGLRGFGSNRNFIGRRQSESYHFVHCGKRHWRSCHSIIYTCTCYDESCELYRNPSEFCWKIFLFHSILF